MTKQATLLVSTTRSWNIGDEFIDIGVRYLLRPFLPKDCNWRLWNRNPDLSIDPVADWTLRADLRSNVALTLNRSLVDMVVFSGTPEWLGPRCRPLFDFLYSNPDVPCLFVGVGSADPLYALSEVECSVLARSNSFVTTRSNILANEINQQLGFAKAVPLPCPALFSSEFYAERIGAPLQKTSLAAIVQTDRSAQPISTLDFNNLRDAINAADISIDLIAIHDSEYATLAAELPQRRLRYSHSAAETLAMLGEYHGLIATRLHGAIAAASRGVMAAIVKRDDYRVTTAAELFSPIIPVLPVATAIDWLTRVDEGQVCRWRRHVTTFKAEVHRRYVQLLEVYFEGLRTIS